MGLEELIRDYGYLAIFIGTFLEGETIQILGGLSAHTGFLKFHWVVLTGCIGTLLGDQLYFFIGRRYGTRFLEKRPGWQVRVARVHHFIERYHELAILTFRFFYGLRNVASFAMGTSQIPTGRFIVLNALGAIIWAVVMAGIGYFFGAAVEKLMGEGTRYELLPLVILAIIGGIAYTVHVVRTRRQTRKALSGQCSPDE